MTKKNQDAKKEADKTIVTETDFYEINDAPIVCGFYVDEPQLEVINDRIHYDNHEIDDHLDIYFHFFGMNDMDIVYLFFLSEKRQHDIKEIMGKTQPAISYDVTRIKKQLDFVINIIAYVDDFIAFIIDEKNGLTLFERELLLVFFFCTSIVKTSVVMGFGQISCRIKILRAIDRVKELGYDYIYEILRYVAENLNNIKKTINEDII